MQQGTIIEIEPSTGVGVIQPHDGTENAYFLHQEVDELLQPKDVVTFDIDNERKISTAPGLQAVNIKIVR